MAAAVRNNNVWVAPRQDAQFLLKTSAPLTSDGLRGEDHGQVLCNTRDAIPGTSSFHDYNLVGARIIIIFFFPRLPLSITGFTGVSRFNAGLQCVADQSKKKKGKKKRLFSFKDVTHDTEGRPV